MMVSGLVILWALLVVGFAALVAWRAASTRGLPISAVRGPALYGLLSGALALFGVLYGGTALAEAAASRSWPAVEGQITRAEVIEHRIAGRGISGRTYEPVVEYTYDVDGTPFTGSRLAFALTTRETLPAVAEAQIAPYQPGEAVTVYANPNAPQRSVLERRVDLQAWLALGGGLALMAGHLLAAGRRG